MVFGFAVALLLNQRLRGNWFFAIAVLLPWAVPALAASAIFKWLFDSRYGFVNWALVQPRLRRLSGLRLVRRALQRVRRDLRHRRLAVVPVHRARAAGGAADDPARRRCTPPRSTAPARGALPAGDAAAAAADRRRAGHLLHDLGLQDLRPDLRDGRGRAGPRRRHRGGRRLPRGLRAPPLRAGQRGRRRAVPDPAGVLAALRAPDRPRGARHEVAAQARLDVRRDGRRSRRSRCSRSTGS